MGLPGESNMKLIIRAAGMAAAPLNHQLLPVDE
jgi:hypothetical protein